METPVETLDRLCPPGEILELVPGKAPNGFLHEQCPYRNGYCHREVRETIANAAWEDLTLLAAYSSTPCDLTKCAPCIAARVALLLLKHISYI